MQRQVVQGHLLVGSSILTDGNWHHIAVTRTGSSGAIKLYVDGNQQGTGTRKGSFTSATSKINIGWFNGYGYYNNGSIDEAAIYNTALSSTEIQQHYSNGLNNIGYCGGSAKIISTTFNSPFDYFDVMQESEKVKLSWQTATEIAGNFEIERLKEEGSGWMNIGIINEAESGKRIEYVDKTISNEGKYSYRIKLIVKDGGYAYSQTAEVTVLPMEYKLYQNYPNPFNPITRIKYSLPIESEVNIEIYNILGERITEIKEGIKGAGYYEAVWNAE